MFLGAAVLALVLALLIDDVVRRTVPAWFRLPIVGSITWILSFNDDPGWLLVLLMSHILIPNLTRRPHWSLRPDPSWATWPLLLDLAACAIAANVKGAFLLMAGVIAAELAILELWGRRAPVVSGGFVILIVVLARLSGMRFGDWGPYAQHIIGSLSGYPESFSRAGSPLLAGLLVSTVLAFLTLAASSARHSTTRFDAIVRWNALALLLWMIAKGALVRQDRAHEIRSIMALAIFFMLYVVAHCRDWRLQTKVLTPLPALALGALFVLPKSEPPPTLPTAARHLQKFSSFVLEGTGPAMARDTQARREVAGEVKRPWSPTSSIAVFGTHQSLALGHPGRYVTLPIVAPYEIWSPWTSRRERDFLMGPDAPDYLLYTTSPTSAELALALTARYAEVEWGPRHRLLQRRPMPLTVKRRVVFEGNVNAGVPIEIPPEWQAGPAIVQVHYTKPSRPPCSPACTSRLRPSSSSSTGAPPLPESE